MQISFQTLQIKKEKKKLHSECLNVSKNTVSWLLPMFTVKHRDPQKKHKLLRNRIFIKLQRLIIILLHSQAVPKKHVHVSIISPPTG